MIKKLGNKLLFACLSIMVIVTLGTTMFTVYARLDEPIFFDHYISQSWNNPEEEILTAHFVIHYISDRDDLRWVNGVDFLDVDKGSVFSYAGDVPSSEGFSLYTYRAINITVQSVNTVNSELVLNRAIFHFNDGSSQEVDLGVIILDNMNRDDSDILNFVNSRGDSDGLQSTIFETREDLTILGLRFDPAIDHKELFSYSFNQGQSTVPFILKRNESITLNFENFDVKRPIFYSLKTFILVENLAGESLEIELPSVAVYNHSRPSSFLELFRIRGGRS